MTRKEEIKSEQSDQLLIKGVMRDGGEVPASSSDVGTDGDRCNVYVTGNMTHATELDLATWAEQIWGEVDTVIIGYHQAVISFSTPEAAEMCSRQGKAKFNGTLMEMFQHKLCYTNGVYVGDLDPTSRRSDVMNTFRKFGNIAFIKGPFGQARASPIKMKEAVVVFKHLEGMMKALGCADIVLEGNKLFVKKNLPGKKPQRTGKCNPTTTEERAEHQLSVAVLEEAVEVEVLHVESPDEIWYRLACDKDRWMQFYQDLQEASEKFVTLGSGAMLKTGQKVLCWVESAWYRGSVVCMDSVCQVKLVDFGLVVRVDIQNVKKLENSSFAKKKLFAKSFQLEGIEAAGSGGWSASSVDLLINFTKKRKVFLVKKDTTTDLMVEESTANNPLDVETVIRISLADVLLERGLALPKNTRSKCARSWTVVGDETPRHGSIVDNDKCNNERINQKENILCNSQFVTPSFYHCSSSSILPPHPTEQVFTAMFVHIDCSAVVWVIPKAKWHILSEIVLELGKCSDPVQEISPGIMVVARLRGKSVRATILEEEEREVVRMVDIDSGEMFVSDTQILRKCPPSLLSKPPLAIPLKLYGVRKTTSALCEAGRAAVLEKMREKSKFVSPLWCSVSIMERNRTHFPLPANVRYTMVEEYDGNLALDLLEVGLCDVIKSCNEWEKEFADHGLDWMLDLMSVSVPLTFLPHPLPLAVGQWLHVSVEALEFPLLGGEEHEPGVETPDANRIGVHIRPLDSKSTFDQHQQEICRSLRTISPQIQKLNTYFSEGRTSLAISASTAEMVTIPTVGQSVLVYYKFEEEGGEWCRGTVETIQSKELVTVFYTDYGHRGLVEMGHLRSMGYEERMMPVELREVVFLMPNSNGELKAVRSELGQERNLKEGRLLMRVDKISPKKHQREVAEIQVSVWSAVDGGSDVGFRLSRIC
eukprot:GFUD01035893.1.p1 GENE.GFUD01035893.1~~GFUD01035893.1.p1  ORF type:complete len:931 (+),score=248.18 GFUD01035893.1:289-3081(+)